VKLEFEGEARPAKKPSATSFAEDAFAAQWDAQTIMPVAPEREFKFHPERRWRFDFCWPALKLAVEIEGRGRHQTFVGFRNDCEKYNEALRLGWRVLRYPASDHKPSKSRKIWPDGARDWVLDVLEVACAAK
jgi:hypothetical protein